MYLFVDKSPVLETFNEFKEKVMQCKMSMDTKSSKLSPSLEKEVDEVYQNILKIDRDYKQHLENEQKKRSEGTSKGKSRILEEDENRMKKFLKKWTVKMNKIFEKRNISQVCVVFDIQNNDQMGQVT